MVHNTEIFQRDKGWIMNVNPVGLVDEGDLYQYVYWKIWKNINTRLI